MVKLNHENLSFKLSKPHEPWGDGFERYPVSLEDIQNDIYGCDICQKLKYSFCIYHNRMIQGRPDLFNTVSNNKNDVEI